MNPLIIVAIVVVVVLLIVYISIRNNISRTQVKIDEASAGIDVALQKRYDVLTKMLDVVKAYTKYEKETILEVIKVRKGMSMDEKVEADKKMSEEFSKISVVAENYPELRSSDNYKTLQQAIADTEEHLQAARRLYNSSVSQYNQKIVTFPGNMIAKKINATKKEFFKVEDEKKDYKVEL